MGLNNQIDLEIENLVTLVQVILSLMFTVTMIMCLLSIIQIRLKQLGVTVSPT